MGCHVLLYRSLAGVCCGDPSGETGHEQSPYRCDRTESWPPAALVWPLQTEVDHRLQGQGDGGANHGPVCTVSSQWGRVRNFHAQYDYLNNTLGLTLFSAEELVDVRQHGHG